MAVFLIGGRGRWLDLIGDHGVGFSYVQSLRTGGRLMDDLRAIYGPLSIWFLGIASRIVGLRFDRIAAVQVAFGTVDVLLVLRLSRRFLGEVERIFCAAALAVLIVWMPGPGNLLYPYAFAASFGLFLALLSLEVGVRALDSESWLLAAFAGLVGGAAWASKQDMGAVALTGLAALGVASGRRAKVIARSLLAFGVGFALSLTAILRAFQGPQSFREMAGKNALWPFTPIPRAILINMTRQQGLHDLSRTSINVLQSTVIVALAGIVLWLASEAFRSGRRKLVSALAAGAILLIGYWELWIRGGDFVLLSTCLPVLVCGGGIAFWRWVREPASRPVLTSFFAILPGSLLLLYRVGFTGVTAGTYAGIGYVLAVPISIFFVGEVCRATGAGSRLARTRLGIVVGFIAAIGLVRFGQGRLRELKSEWLSAVPIRSSRGVAYVNPGWADAFPAAVEFLRRETRPGDPILVVPETKGIDFLLDRRNDAFWPTQGPGLGLPGEKELIERWEREPPAAIVIFENTLGFYSAGDFGTGYDVALMGWIDRHYSLSGRIAPPGGVAVRLYRKNVAEPRGSRFTLPGSAGAEPAPSRGPRPPRGTPRRS